MHKLKLLKVTLDLMRLNDHKNGTGTPSEARRPRLVDIINN